MDADILIVGSGMGGATLAAALAPTGKRIVILERGERLADSPEARDATAIFRRGHFRPKETWADAEGRPFNPGNYAFVGGNTKFYGAVLLRYRAEDFGPLRHIGGVTPGWPFGYDEIEPFYSQAEQLYRVRGELLAIRPSHHIPPPIPFRPCRTSRISPNCGGLLRRRGCIRHHCRLASTSTVGWRVRRPRGMPFPIARARSRTRKAAGWRRR